MPCTEAPLWATFNFVTEGDKLKGTLLSEAGAQTKPERLYVFN